MMTLYWKFINGHEWTKYFENENDVYHFIHTTAIAVHPDIVSVYYVDGDNKKTVVLAEINS